MLCHKFPVIILAAGESKRFGSAKQLANWKGKSLLVSIIDKVQSCDVQPHVALGGHYDEIFNSEEFLPFRDLVIPIRNWRLGMSATLKECISFFDQAEIEGLVFLLGDQPLIEPSFLKGLFSRVASSPIRILCTSYPDMPGCVGVPAYFPKKYFEQISQLEGDQGAKRLLLTNSIQVLMCENDLLDIDEPADLAHALAKP